MILVFSDSADFSGMARKPDRWWDLGAIRLRAMIDVRGTHRGGRIDCGGRDRERSAQAAAQAYPIRCRSPLLFYVVTTRPVRSCSWVGWSTRGASACRACIALG